jgi:hypothetical protein
MADPGNVTLAGDFAKLAALAGAVRRAASKALLEQVARAIAPAVVRLARDGGAQGRDPYGAAWAPRRDGGPANLRAVLAALTATALKNRVRMRVRHPGARVHQYGAVIKPKRKAGGRGGYREGRALRFELGGRVVFARRVAVPQRQYMPEADRGLGAEWTAALARVTDGAVQAFFKDF